MDDVRSCMLGLRGIWCNYEYAYEFDHGLCRERRFFWLLPMVSS